VAPEQRLVTDRGETPPASPGNGGEQDVALPA